MAIARTHIHTLRKHGYWTNSRTRLLYCGSPSMCFFNSMAMLGHALLAIVFACRIFIQFNHFIIDYIVGAFVIFSFFWPPTPMNSFYFLSNTTTQPQCPRPSRMYQFSNVMYVEDTSTPLAHIHIYFAWHFRSLSVSTYIWTIRSHYINGWSARPYTACQHINI